MPDRHTFLFADPYVEAYYDQLETLEAARHRLLTDTLTVDDALAAVQAAQMYPTASKQLVTSVGVSGMNPASPAVADLVQRDWEQRNNGLWDRIFGGAKGLVRGAFTIFETLWEEGFSRPFRTLVAYGSQGPSPDELRRIEERYGLARGSLGNKLDMEPEELQWFRRAQADGMRFNQTNLGLYDTYKRSGESYGVRAMRALFGGPRQPVNLGSGFIPRSQEAEEFDMYDQMVTQGWAPGAAGQQVLAAKGQPITRLAQEQAEALTYRGQPISPGRVLAGIVPVEPGTVPYHLVSGTLDAAARIWLDPTYWSMKGVSRARQMNRVFGADVDTGARTLLHPGSSPRPSVFRPTATQVFNSARGNKLVSALADTDEIASMVQLFGKRHRLIPRRVYDQIASTSDPNEVRRVLIEAANRGMMRDIPMPRSLTGSMLERAGITEGGTLSGAIGRGFGGELGELGGFRAGLRYRLDQHGWGRTFHTMPEQFLSVDNLDAGFYAFDDFLISAGLTAEQRSGHLTRWAKLADGASADDAWAVVKPALKHIEGRLALDYGQIPGVNRALAREMARKVTDSFGHLDDLRKYDLDTMGRAAFHPGGRMRLFRRGGGGQVLPSAHLTSEMLQRGIPLPDARALRKAQGKIRRLLLSRNHQGDTLIDVMKRDPFGENMLNQLADPFMQKWWKPFTLLRLAWPVRVLGEEQLRAAAAGYSSMFSHPLQYMGWVLYDPDGSLVRKAIQRIPGVKRRGGIGVLGDPAVAGRYTDKDIYLALADEHGAAMTHGTHPFIGRTGPKAQRVNFTTYTPDQQVYHRVWAGELRQLWQDEVAPQVAGMTRNQAKRWFASDEALEARRSLAQSGVGFGDIVNNADMQSLYIDSVWARLQIKTGGDVRLRFDTTGSGDWIDIDPKNVPKDLVALLGFDEMGRRVPGKADWSQVRRRLEYQPTEYVGNQQLLEMISTGQWTRTQAGQSLVTDLRQVEGSSDTMTDLVRTLRKDFGDAQPEFVKGPVDAERWNRRWRGRRAGTSKNAPDEFVENMFTMLMSKPTDFLSRSPVFSQTYWKRAEELIGFGSHQVQASILRAAREANLPGSQIRRMARVASRAQGRRATSTYTASQAARITAVREMDSAELIPVIRDSRVFNMLDDLRREGADLDDFTRLIRDGGPVEEGFWALSELWRRLPDQFDGRLLDWALRTGDLPPSQFLDDLDAWRVIDPDVADDLSRAGTLDELLGTLDNAVYDASRGVDLDAAVLENLPDIYRPIANHIGFDRFRQLLLEEDPAALSRIMDELDDMVRDITALNQQLYESTRQSMAMMLSDALEPRATRNYGLTLDDLKNRRLAVDDDSMPGASRLIDTLGPGARDTRLRRFGSPEELLDFANRKGWSMDDLSRWLLGDEMSAHDRLSRFLQTRRGRSGAPGRQGPPTRPGTEPTRPGGPRGPMDTPGATARYEQHVRFLDAMEDPRMAGIMDEMDDLLRVADRGGHIDEIDDLFEIDRLAKGFALDEVKRLLYDTTRKHQFMDAYRNVFPFGEAWVEIIGTWSRLMYENPQIWRRAQQFFEGARGSGFFTVDESTGEEMFNYPAAGVLGGLFSRIADLPVADQLLPGAGLSDLLTEGDPTTAVFQGRVAGLNLVAGQWLPGFGPVIQIPASHLLESSIIDPVVELLTPFQGVEFRDTVREFVLPFGEQKVSGDLPLKMLPMWMRRIASAAGIQDPNMARLKANTTIDVMKALILQGHPVNSLEDANQLVSKASRIADQLTLVRGIAQMFSPTGPEVKFFTHADLSPEDFAAELRGLLAGKTTAERDQIVAAVASTSSIEAAEQAATEAGVDMRQIREAQGKMWLYQSMAGAYREALFDRFDGDDAKAFDWFTKRFGLDPTVFATPKSIQVQRRHTTYRGDQWARDNMRLFEAAPLTAYYANPDSEDDDFHYPAYLRQLETEARQPLDPDQWLWRRNDTLGRIIYNKARADADDRFGPRNSPAKQEALRLVRFWLTDEFPGYRQPIPGAPEKPSVQSKIRELEEQWPLYPELHESPTGQAVVQYLKMRAWAMGEAQNRGLNPESFATAKRMADIRGLLREWGERLSRKHPDFQYLWTLVLSHELTDDDDPATLGTSETQPATVGADDIFGTGGEL